MEVNCGIVEKENPFYDVLINFKTVANIWTRRPTTL